MPNRDLPVSGMQVLALDVEVAFTETALVAEVLGVSPGPADAEHDGYRSDALRLPEQGRHQRPLSLPARDRDFARVVVDAAPRISQSGGRATRAANRARS
jgi:hypothetical protein